MQHSDPRAALAPDRDVLGAKRTYYVDPTSDPNASNRLSTSSAFQTIRQVIDAAVDVDAMGNAATDGGVRLPPAAQTPS